MLELISWHDFIQAIALLTSAYYLITAPWLYRSELYSFFKEGKFSHDSTNDAQPSPATSESSHLMGAVRQSDTGFPSEAVQSSVPSEELEVVTEEYPDPPIATVADRELEEMAINLRDEVQTLVRIVTTDNTEECEGLFRTLLSNYSLLADTSHRVEITRQIHESLKNAGKAAISLDQADAWWPFPSSKYESSDKS